MVLLLITMGIIAITLAFLYILARRLHLGITGPALVLAGLLALGIALSLPYLAPFLTEDYYLKLAALVVGGAGLVTLYNAALLRRRAKKQQARAAEKDLLFGETAGISRTLAKGKAALEEASQQEDETPTETETATEGPNESLAAIASTSSEPTEASSKVAPESNTDEQPKTDTKTYEPVPAAASTAFPSGEGAEQSEADEVPATKETPASTVPASGEPAGQQGKAVSESNTDEKPKAETKSKKPAPAAAPAAFPSGEGAEQSEADGAPDTKVPSASIVPASGEPAEQQGKAVSESNTDEKPKTETKSKKPAPAAAPAAFPSGKSAEQSDKQTLAASGGLAVADAPQADGAPDTKEPPAEAASASDESEQSPIKAAPPLPDFPNLDALLDYADAAQKESRPEDAIRAYHLAVKRYADDPYVPYLFIDLGNLLKAAGRYPECVDVYKAALLNPTIAENDPMAAEFQKNLRYLTVVEYILKQHNAPNVPFGSIEPAWLAEIETAYQKVQQAQSSMEESK